MDRFGLNPAWSGHVECHGSILYHLFASMHKFAWLSAPRDLHATAAFRRLLCVSDLSRSECQSADTVAIAQRALFEHECG